MTASSPGFEFQQTIPIFRIFDVAKARAFYLDYLGFRVDWEHRFEPHLPLYMQVTRGALTLHLSEHHGDSTPGAAVYVRMLGIRALHAELLAKNYAFLRPGLVQQDWGMTEMFLIDPFHNCLRLAQETATL